MTTNQQRKEFLNTALNLVKGTPTHPREIFTVHISGDLDVQHLKYSFHRRKIKKSVKKIMGKLGKVVWLISVPALLVPATRERRAGKKRLSQGTNALLKEQWQNWALTTKYPGPAVMTSNSWFCFDVHFSSLPTGWHTKFGSTWALSPPTSLSQLSKPKTPQHSVPWSTFVFSTQL